MFYKTSASLQYFGGSWEMMQSLLLLHHKGTIILPKKLEIA